MTKHQYIDRELSESTSVIATRRIEVTDHVAVAAIAQQTGGFTVPTEYLLWFLSETQGELCRVAIDSDGQCLAYLLAALGVGTGEITVWQLGTAAAIPNAVQAMRDLLDDLVTVAGATGIRSFCFSSDSSRARRVCRLAKAVTGCEPKRVFDRFAPPSERLFRVTVH